MGGGGGGGGGEEKEKKKGHRFSGFEEIQQFSTGREM